MLKKTKIVATLAHTNCSPEYIRTLYKEGMNVVRLNTAHQTPDEALKIIKDVRQVTDKIAFLLDTKGPEIRTANSKNQIKVTENDIINLEGNPEKESTKDCIFVSYKNFAKDVQVGNKILIDDGDIAFDIIEKSNNTVKCKVLNTGLIKSRKSVNVPNVHFNLPSLNEKDKEFIQFAIEQDLEFIAHSFVRNKNDVKAIQDLLDKNDSKIKIIAKIENQQGVDNINEILDNVYGIMVARGDLAIEIPYEKIPGIQRMLIKKCINIRKPVIIATQMLHTMIENPRPTRAEVNDVASAIYSQADAIMLSGETAMGKYPVESVRTMTRIALEVESTKDHFNDIPDLILNTKISAFLSKAAVEASIQLDAKAIIADSMSGRTIRSLSAYRSLRPIYAQCYSIRTVRELALSYGVFANYMEPRETSHEFLSEALSKLLDKNTFKADDIIVVIAGNFGRSYGASFIEVGTVNKLI
ncbi:MAG: pyruvate kinase [Bacteroidales bacterium]|jgi:pyruvate kinase|nr:pyruvate kinase [Bacteroidales bacterium]